MGLYLTLIQIKWTKWSVSFVENARLGIYYTQAKNTEKLTGKPKFHPQVCITPSLGEQALERKGRQHEHNSHFSQKALESA